MVSRGEDDHAPRIWQISSYPESEIREQQETALEPEAKIVQQPWRTAATPQTSLHSGTKHRSSSTRKVSSIAVCYARCSSYTSKNGNSTKSSIWTSIFSWAPTNSLSFSTPLHFSGTTKTPIKKLIAIHHYCTVYALLPFSAAQFCYNSFLKCASECARKPRKLSRKTTDSVIALNGTKTSLYTDKSCSS